MVIETIYSRVLYNWIACFLTEMKFLLQWSLIYRLFSLANWNSYTLGNNICIVPIPRIFLLLPAYFCYCLHTAVIARILHLLPAHTVIAIKRHQRYVCRRYYTKTHSRAMPTTLKRNGAVVQGASFKKCTREERTDEKQNPRGRLTR